MFFSFVKKRHKLRRVEPIACRNPLYGAFHSVFIALRQQGCFKRSENHSKIELRQVRAVLAERIFVHVKTKTAVNTFVLARDLAIQGRKFA